MFVEKITGEQLSSVEFVQDYLQLHFDGPTLTLFTWPVITLPEREARFGDLGYRDVLCGRIGQKVVEVEMKADEALVVRFDDGVAITISLRPEHRAGPEAGHFSACRDSREPLLVF